MNQKQTVLITGTSTGIGKETALYFFNKGWNVVATMRTPEKSGADLVKMGLDVVPMDVLDSNSIREAVEYTINKYGQIDVLVNNAGYSVRGPFEDITLEQIKHQYETNLFGLMNVTRAILPGMREKRNGVIINISSIGGRITFPFYSIYNSSKWAVEGFSEGLCYELRPFGVRVKLIEPGLIQTDFYNRSMVVARNSKVDSYNDNLNHSLEKNRKLELKGSHPEVIARLIYKAANAKNHRLRYYGGANARILLFLRRVLPESWLFFIIRRATL